MADERRERELVAYELQADSQMKNTAFRQMRAVMTRLAKGEIAEKVEIWRTAKRWSMIQQTNELMAERSSLEHSRLQAALHASNVHVRDMQRRTREHADEEIRRSVVNALSLIEFEQEAYAKEEMLRISIASEKHQTAIKMLRHVIVSILGSERAVALHVMKSAFMNHKEQVARRNMSKVLKMTLSLVAPQVGVTTRSLTAWRSNYISSYFSRTELIKFKTREKLLEKSISYLLIENSEKATELSLFQGGKGDKQREAEEKKREEAAKKAQKQSALLERKEEQVKILERKVREHEKKVRIQEEEERTSRKVLACKSREVAEFKSMMEEMNYLELS